MALALGLVLPLGRCGLVLAPCTGPRAFVASLEGGQCDNNAVSGAGAGAVLAVVAVALVVVALLVAGVRSRPRPLA